ETSLTSTAYVSLISFLRGPHSAQPCQRELGDGLLAVDVQVQDLLRQRAGKDVEEHRPDERLQRQKGMSTPQPAGRHLRRHGADEATDHLEQRLACDLFDLGR